jgi:hypothetical protein
MRGKTPWIKDQQAAMSLTPHSNKQKSEQHPGVYRNRKLYPYESQVQVWTALTVVQGSI